MNAEDFSQISTDLPDGRQVKQKSADHFTLTCLTAGRFSQINSKN